MKEYMDKLFCYVLAGGKGRRLQNLTKDTCKPLIKICSHYHLIDFTITNCLNSEIRNMAIVAQYDTMDLIEHLLSSNLRSLSNFHILTPETRRDIEQGIEFQNTAHSVHVNTKVVDDNMEDILIVSADHVYSMDYTKFYKKHLDAGNDLTVSVFEVPYEKATHFGVFEVDEDDNIISFEEKPENPKSNLISMGVYLFKKEKLFDTLNKLVNEIGPDIDFGKHVIPYYLKNYKVGVNKFEWYWADLGTIDALWEFNMKVLDNPDFIIDMFKTDERYKTMINIDRSSPPFFGEDAKLSSAIVGNRTIILGNVAHSVIGNHVLIKKNTEIKNCVIMDDCIIEDGVKIENAVISQNTTVSEDITGHAEIICI